MRQKSGKYTRMYIQKENGRQKTEWVWMEKADKTENTFILMKLYLSSVSFFFLLLLAPYLCVYVSVCVFFMNKSRPLHSLFFPSCALRLWSSLSFSSLSLFDVFMHVNEAENTTVTIQFVLNLLYRIVVRGCKNIFRALFTAATLLHCSLFQAYANAKSQKEKESFTLNSQPSDSFNHALLLFYIGKCI